MVEHSGKTVRISCSRIEVAADDVLANVDETEAESNVTTEPVNTM